MYCSILILFCLNTYENFMSLKINDTIVYNSLQSNSTAFPRTLHIRGTSIELYVHHINFYISGHCFVPQNELLRISCNICSYDHLLFNKAPIYKFLEFLCKLLFSLAFIQFHQIVLLLRNE